VKIYKFNEMSQKEINGILSRGYREAGDIEKIVGEIISDVKANGDDALIRLEKKFDNCDLTKSGFYVDRREINESEILVDAGLKESIDLAIANIRDFHLTQLPRKMWIQPFGRGILAGEIYNPIDSVGLYVPHGKGSFPSVAIMLGVPATIAGVKNIVVITPPDKECNVDPNVLYVCKVLGVSKVLKLGGAQAIAAVALGTKSVEKVSKILGPGSLYVNVAKQLLAGKIDIGLLAGPSESIVIADHTQNPLNVALDLINEAEHGPDSTSLLLTDSSDLVNSVNSLVDKLIERIDENRRRYVEKVLGENGGAIIFDNIDDAISFTNNFAPEHLVLDLSNPFDLLGKIKNAGEILIGPNTPISAANYIAGPNAVLPTSGFAKSMSVLSVRDFLKVTSILKFSPEALLFYRDHIKRLALAEGFPAHALSASERIIVQSKI
jgi:histidinol dehydrogenase